MDLSRYSHLDGTSFDPGFSSTDLAVLNRAPVATSPVAGLAGLTRMPDGESVAFGGLLAAMFVLVMLAPLAATAPPPAHTAAAPVQPASDPQATTRRVAPSPAGRAADTPSSRLAAG